MSSFAPHIIPSASDIFPTVKELIENTATQFVAMGVTFDRSAKRHDPSIRKALERGVKFQYVTLDVNADLNTFSRQFNQTVDELRYEILSSDAVLEKFSQEYGEQFSFYPTKRCPNYRIYISDPESDKPSGIIIFYGASTDSQHLPAYVVDNFSEPPFNRYLDDALKAIKRETNCKVFVIHGHAEAKRRELKAMLRDDLQLEPIVVIDEPDDGASTLIEKFERYALDCAYAIALITPDDLIDKGNGFYLQARPNVLLELGWLMSHLGRQKVMLLIQGDSQLPSDLSGIVVKRFNNNVSEIFREIKQELDRQDVSRR
ncbi:MAG: hypothetical protein F6K00_31575 [Leptolyngbya sp. SIOISBB]|nr:hypothetical protein [Leptolyngbya sp. SIOISBB]